MTQPTRASAGALPTFDEQRQYWEVRWNRQRTPSEFQLRRGEVILEWLRRLHLPFAANILDLGCGTGWFANHLTRFGDVTGVDLSETAIALARSHVANVSFLCGNVFALPLPAGEFDVVVAQEVIAHVPDQAAFVRRIAELLKPRGYLIVTTANKLVMQRVDWVPEPPGHIEQWLTMRRFRALLVPQFAVLRSASIMPVGNRGFLRLVNSVKLNTALASVIPRRYLERLKERLGVGYTLVVLARKAP